MSRRAAAWVAWTLFVLFGVAAAGSVVLSLDGRGTGADGLVFLVLGFATVGALVATRQPANSVGWLLLGIAVAFGCQSLADAYIRVAGRPGEVAVAWYSSWAWYVWLVLAALVLPLVYPDGRLLSRRWRLAVGLAVATLALSIVGAGVQPGALDVEAPREIDNPLGVSGAWAGTAEAMNGVFFVVGLGLAIASLVRRLRRSRGRGRQQVKLFALVGSMALAGFSLAVVAEFFEASQSTWVFVVGSVGWLSGLFLVVVGIPAAIGVAILRHRLYDIDLVIKRTLVYGSLTAMLAVTYLGLVLTLRLALQPATGESDLAVAASTLAVAALFRPLRARIQQVVDHRFYRARYDAARTLESFSGRLRAELDLDALGSDLRRVVSDTMQPAHVSLWLRGPT